MPVDSRPINYCDMEPIDENEPDWSSDRPLNAGRNCHHLSSTEAVHGNNRRENSHHSLTVPIVQSSVYTFQDSTALIDFVQESGSEPDSARDKYGRYGNPTVRAAERRVAELERAETALLVSSGMAAITGTLLLMLSAGDHMILTNESYHSTLVFSAEFLKRYDIACTVVPYGDYDALESAIQPNTRLIFSESPTNPFMHCLNWPRFTDIAKRHGLKTIVDTTFATPYNFRALEHGVDIVIHSVTKYLAGHNDLMAGAIVGSHEMLEPLRDVQGMLGSIVAPNTAYLILRGLKTLALRVEQQNKNGLEIARFLDDHPKVRRVWYLGLDSHPHHSLAAQDFVGYGGVVTFEIEGNADDTYRFLDTLQIATIGPSLGGVETLVSPLSLMAYAEISADERAALGISDALVRLCLGIEDTNDLLDDLNQALAVI